jgi:transaldolase
MTSDDGRVVPGDGVPAPLQALAAAGVAVWLDDLSRDMLTGGELARLVRERGVVGVTTNPTIFAAAIGQGSAYDEQLAALADEGVGVEDAALALMTEDVRRACDLLADLHRGSDGLHGRVSLEVSPTLAHDAAGTVAMARRLWQAVDRPNLYVKIPATAAGLPAITEAIADGINVNVTLIFSLDRYRGVLDAYATGLERARAAGRDLASIDSVASFFVSRVDTAVDARLDEIGSPEAAALRGTIAIANARLAYEVFEQFTAGDRWQALAAAGARPQRPLWASTGVKDPAYPDTRYVDELVAPGTVNTMPGSTLEAVADHGRTTAETVRGRYDEARELLDRLAALGVDLAAVTDELEEQGVAKFEASWDELCGTVADGLRGAAA